MVSDSSKHAYWADHIQRWQASGLPRATYARREWLVPSAFDYWYHRLRQFTAGETGEPAAAKLTLVPVSVVAPASDIQLRTPSGWQVALPATLERGLLTHLLAHLP